MDDFKDSLKADSIHLSSGSNPYVYMKVCMTMEDGPDEWTATLWKYNVIEILKEFLGQVGAATPVDVLKLLPGSTAILRVPNKMSASVWSALTLCGKTSSGVACAFRVKEVSPFLMALCRDVRDASY